MSEINNKTYTIEYLHKKNLFIKNLNDLKKQKEINDKFYETTQSIDLLDNGFVYNNRLLEDNIIKLLQLLTKYPIDVNNTIEWWVHEIYFGQNTHCYFLKPKNKEEDNDIYYKLLTPENLWHYLNDEFDNLIQVTEEELKEIEKLKK